MFVATTLLYPCVLAALCIGSGLLVERVSGALLAAALLVPVGAAGLIAVSQLTTLAYPIAPATPYVMAAVALAGAWLGRRRLAAIARRARASAGVADRAGAGLCDRARAGPARRGARRFSSYMALADSAVHMIGADFLIRHGQHYAHLDLRNSYGRFINGYYDNSYPSGADTLFGGSALLLRLPLIWAFQPFNAFMLAAAVGPAWLLARRFGLRGAWAAAAALSAVTARRSSTPTSCSARSRRSPRWPLILTLGALVAEHRSWLQAGARRGLPFAHRRRRWHLRARSGLRRVGALRSARARRDARPWRLRPCAPGCDAAPARTDARARWWSRRCRRGSGCRARCSVAQNIAATTQPGQPAQPAAREPGARRVARRQLQARPPRRRRCTRPTR